MDFKQTLETYRLRSEAALHDHLPAADVRPGRLHAAMRYSLDAGGKRLRPVLVFAMADLGSAPLDAAPAAAAVEALHTYSLIHDDLPCMDNSDLRRGRATCHKHFDEATALLAGDALLTEAFYLLAYAYEAHPVIAVALVKELGDASGSRKLIGGQMEDLLGLSEGMDEDRLRYIHRSKTAALLTACVKMGAHLARLPKEAFEHAETVGHHLGMAFQIIDDILDATADTAVLGKTAGLDEQNATLTFPKLYGLEASRRRASEHTQQAIAAAKKLGPNSAFLVGLIEAMEHRIN